MKNRILIASVAALSLSLCACDFGQVEQGRTVAYDKEQGVVTLMQDANHSSAHPQYTGQLVTFKKPVDPKEMGPEPTAGGRLAFSAEKNMMKIYNPNTKAIQDITVQTVEVKQNVLRDDPLVKGKTFPVVDKAAMTVTTYSPRQRVLAVIKVPADVIDLPESTWKAGDDMRVYYKQAGQALRMMNVSQTNIYKR